MVLRGFPNVVTCCQQYNIGEKPTVTLYTDINHHVGIPKQKTRNTTNLDVQNIWTKSSELQYSNCKALSLSARASRLRVLGFVLAMKV